MGTRREGREAAIQFLFQCDLNPQDYKDLIDNFWELRPASKAVHDFAGALVEGVLTNQIIIDDQLKKHTANYQLHRIAAVDRNVLRVAVYEMLFCNEIPPVVSINEAIEIAKRFGSEESGGFVNGILDRIKLDLPRPSREPKEV